MLAELSKYDFSVRTRGKSRTFNAVYMVRLCVEPLILSLGVGDEEGDRREPLAEILPGG